MIVDPDFLDHPKTIKLQRLLGTDAPLMMLRIWAHCQQRRSDQLGRDPEDIAAICRWPGKASKLLGALVSCRWLDETDAGYVARGWRELNALWLSRIEGGKTRAASARRAASGPLAGSFQPASSQLAGSLQPSSNEVAGESAGAEERRGEEKRVEPPPSPSAQTRVCARTCEDALAETSSLCLLIFGKKRSRLGSEAEHALARHAADLPLTAEQVALLTWFYSLPHNPDDFDIRSRYRDADNLAKNLFVALERATSYSQRTGDRPKNGAEKNAAPDAEPAGCWEWFAGEYPEQQRPPNWLALPASIRSEFSLAMERSEA